jgi:spore maturation protein CgeB
MRRGLNIAFFGSSLVSAYWNGAATYYRGIVRALAGRGHRVTFYEPDAYERQAHRDMDDPSWAKVVVYEPNYVEVLRAIESAANADLLIKTSGIGVFDEQLEALVPQIASPHTITAFWDVDAPATLDRVNKNPADEFRSQIPLYDLIFTYGGGPPVVDAYGRLGAKLCTPIYNALDTSTHFPVPGETRFEADLSLLANRLPDREARIEEFFLQVADNLPEKDFLLGGNGWGDKAVPKNLRLAGHVFTEDHNAFNCSSKLVLNVSRESMARYGYSPATRVFEAAGAAACVVTDAWKGVELFFEPGREILVAENGTDVERFAREVTSERAKSVGEAAYQKVRAAHTYEQRVDELERILDAKTCFSRTNVYLEQGIPASHE